MKRKIEIVAVLLVATVCGYCAFQSASTIDMSEFALANIEALAAGENDGICRTNADYTAICNYYDKFDPCPCGF